MAASWLLCPQGVRLQDILKEGVLIEAPDMTVGACPCAWAA